MANKGEYSQVVEIDDDLIEEPQLEFQDFPTIVPNTTNPYNSTTFTPNQNQSTSGIQAFLSIERYSIYFDVDTAEIVDRIKSVFLFWQSGSDRFVDQISTKPDLYGPFWIATSLVCGIFAVSSLMTAVGFYLQAKPLVYDFSIIWSALASIYAYTFITPALLYLAAHYAGAKPILLELIDVYGYSMVAWLPAVVLAGTGIEWLRWLSLLATAAFSAYFLSTNIYPTLKRSELTPARTGLLFALVGCHILFAICIKYQYLSYEVGFAATPDAPKAGDK